MGHIGIIGAGWLSGLFRGSPAKVCDGGSSERIWCRLVFDVSIWVDSGKEQRDVQKIWDFVIRCGGSIHGNG